MLDKFRTQNLIWDRANKKMFEVVVANSGDANGRKLRVQVVNNGEIETTLGVSLSLAWSTQNKEFQGLDAFTLVDATLGIYEITYPTGMTANTGLLNASLVLNMSGSIIESEPFKINVHRTVVDDEAVESSNSFTALVTALQQVQGFQQVKSEILASRVGEDGTPHANLKTRLDDEQQKINAQLADKANQIDLVELASQTIVSENDPDPNSDWRIWFKVHPYGVLYNIGDEYPHLTGGWHNVIQTGEGTTAKESDYLHLTTVATGGRSFETVKKVNFTITQMSVLKFELEYTNSNASLLRLGIHSVSGNTSSGGYTKFMSSTESLTRQVLSLSTAGVTGEYYISLRVQGTSGSTVDFKIYKVWGE